MQAGEHKLQANSRSQDYRHQHRTLRDATALSPFACVPLTAISKSSFHSHGDFFMNVLLYITFYFFVLWSQSSSHLQVHFFTYLIRQTKSALGCLAISMIVKEKYFITNCKRVLALTYFSNYSDVCKTSCISQNPCGLLDSI